MDNMDLNVRIVNKSDNALPAYHNPGDSGMDVRAFLKGTVILHPGERALIPTGIFVALPKGYEFQVRPRSGLAFRKGITVLNTPGTVDADYRGEIKVIILNTGKDRFEINNGDRVCQMVLQEVPRVSWEEVESLDETVRNETGFGDSGIK